MKRRWIAHWELVVAAQAVALALWLAEPKIVWAVAAGGLAVWLTVAAALTRRIAVLVTGIAGTAAAVAVLDTTARVSAVEQSWLEARQFLVERANRRRDETLMAAVARVRALAARAAAIETDSREQAFALLREAIGVRGPEQGVVIIDSDGRPWSWAGRHRVQPQPAAPELFSRITPFYRLLEARRQVGERTAVAHILLAADPSVPDRDRTVASRFMRATGAGLEFYAPGAAPAGADVLHFCIPSCTPLPGASPPDTLFSVRTVPPAQGTLKLSLLALGSRWAALLSIATLGLLLLVGGSVGRWGGLIGVVGMLVFTPAGQRLGGRALFSTATYFLDALGPMSASAGALFLSAAVVFVGIVQLAGQGLRRAAHGVLLALLLVVGTPYLIAALARGI
ncbi:MAG: hypothetical protein ACE5JM_14540, partial [Armatimonadota bacterium]